MFGLRKRKWLFFSQKLNLKPEQQYTRDPVEQCFGQKLKFILMMTSRDFHNDRSRFCYDRSRFSWWQVKILLLTVEIFMMTGRDYFFRSWCYLRKQEWSVSLRFHFLVFVVNQENCYEEGWVQDSLA